MPPPLNPRAPSAEASDDALRAFAARGGDAARPEVTRVVGLLAEHAPALLPLALADPPLAADVAEGLDAPRAEPELRAALETTVAGLPDGPELRRALRRFRHRGIVRVALREIVRAADLEETSAEMASLASVVIDAALTAAQRTERERFGEARDPDGAPITLTVLGMGKLGGRELNLGSDVDLCFFYGTDEGACERGGLSVHELFDRVARRAVRILADVTEDGFCFRVDLRLRPEGSRGPLVNSLASAERYYEAWGRSWERAALLRARPVAGDLALGSELLSILRPFIFRRVVDPSLAAQMGELLVRSRRELEVDEARDVKLGRGGIREAEFFVQTLQLIWGGRHPGLQVPGTLEGLRRLAAAGLVTDREAQTLLEGWSLLRRVEHRIHAWAGYQTHALPVGAERERFARSLGLSGAAQLEERLARCREGIARLFESLQPGEHAPDDWDPLLDAVAQGAASDTLATELSRVIPAIREPHEAAAHLARLARRAGAPLGSVTRERSPALGRDLLGAVRGAANPDAALASLADFFARVGDPTPYEHLLLDEPRLTRRLVMLFGASGTLSSTLIGHPEDIDALLTHACPPPQEVWEAHAKPMDDPPSEPEALVSELRRIKRDVTLRVGLAYVSGETSLEQATASLSALAEAQVRASFAAAWRWATSRWGEVGAAMVVCAMGKLGGGELGFAGDLDLVFFYERDGETASGTTYAEVFTRIAQRTMSLLRQPDAEGPGYETDTRLRPSGSKGTLVVSLDAFDAYHRRGAAAWERQALIRARPIAGDAALATSVAARTEHLAYEQGAGPAAELAHTRARVQHELAGESTDRYHPKLGFGGLIEVEFLVQWLQMRHGARTSVRTPSTPLAIRALAREGLLGEGEAEQLFEAQSFFRTVEQRLRLLDEHREPLLLPRGPSGEYVARSLALTERDGLAPAAVLDELYRGVATRVRDLFERHVAPVDAPPPWGRA